MRNTKLWSVLLAAVLLCACVVGVLFVGTQAAGTAYTWTVDGVGTETDCYATIDAAMIAADAKTWAAGDSLTLSVTAETTTTFNTAATGGEKNTGRNLFNIRTIFRDDNTKLPITIDGGESKNAILITEPVWSLSSMKSFSATNDYTFKNLNLSSWGSSAYAFYAGAGMVTFENVDFGDTQTMIITPAVGGWTPFVSSWNKAKFDANAVDGLLETGFILKNTNYGKNNATLTCRSCDEGISTDGVKVNDLTIKTNMLRNKIVVGTGSTVANINHHSADKIKTLAYAPAESVIEVDGGTITNVFSVRGGYTGVGNKLVFNMKSGTVTYLRMGPNGADGKFTGDLELNWTGGTVTELRAAYRGTVDGDVTFNAKGMSFAWGDNSIVGSTVTGTLYNNIEDCTLTGQLYMSGKAANVVNTLKGTISTSDNYSYFGTNGAAISGNVTNNIAASIEYTGEAPANDRFLCGGSNSGSVGGTITNNILPGADISDFPFYAGSNTNTVGAIENNISGGHVATYYAGNTGNNTTELALVTNTLAGGTIDNFSGASADATANVKKVINNIGKVEEDGSYFGTAWIQKFHGGAIIESTKVGEIENNYYSGTIGAANRDDEATWFVATTYGFGGSVKGTVGVIYNNFYGGTFNVGFFFGGNNGATFDNTTYPLAEGESQVNNKVYGGHFARFCGGSNSGAISTISNYVAGDSEKAISVRSYAFYCGEGAANATVYNTLAGYAPVSVDDDGVIDSTSSGMYGGGNGTTPANIVNTIKNAAVIDTFYAGSNSAVGATTYSTTVTKDADSEVAPVIGTFYGGNSKLNANTVATTSITNTVEAGEIGTYFGAHNVTSAIEGSIGTITNNITGGKIGPYHAGTNKFDAPAASVTVAPEFNVTKIVNNIGSETEEGRPVFTGYFMGGVGLDTTANSGKIKVAVLVADIENTFDHACINGSAYLGNRYQTVENITSTINNLEAAGSALILGNNVGTLNGTVNTTINGLTLRCKLVTDVNSTDCVVGANAQFNLTIAEGAKIYLDRDANFNTTGNFPAKGTHTLNVTSFDLVQNEFWAAGVTYFVGDTTGVNAVDNVPGMAVVAADKITGASTVETDGVYFTLTERVAVNIIFDKDMEAEYGEEIIKKYVAGKKISVKGNVVTVYGIGLDKFNTEITFAGLFNLPSDANTIVKIADKGNEINDVYKAIADFGRVYAGGEAQYGLVAGATNTTVAPSVDPDYSKLQLTGKNLIMSDAMGIRYYATLVGETTIEDIVVEIEGKDYTDACNIAVVNEETGEITIDFYLGIGYMDKALDVKISAADTVVLEYTEYADAIAQKIIDNQEDDALATAALVYIQAANTL